jgi:hypothetical protein
MTTVTLSAAGPAPAELAWARYDYLARWSSWSPQIRSVHVRTDEGERPANAVDRLAPGLRGTVHGVLGLRIPFVITEVDRPTRRWAWQVRLGPATVTLVHRVVRQGDATMTTLRVSGPAPLVLGYLAPARVALGRLVRA